MMSEMSPRDRLMTALRSGMLDRVPCSPNITRWARGNYGCSCPHHQLKVHENHGFDPFIFYGQYTWQSISNHYIYSSGGGYNYSSNGVYGDIPDVNVEIKIENTPEHVWYHRIFRTPEGVLNDVIQWARPDVGYGDGSNPHRIEPLVKNMSDLNALKYLYPEPRKDIASRISR